MSTIPSEEPAYVSVYNRLREEILDTTLKPGAAIFEQDLARRYGGEDAHVTEAQAAKRVALQFVTASVASWDHRKLR